MPKVPESAGRWAAKGSPQQWSAASGWGGASWSDASTGWSGDSWQQSSWQPQSWQAAGARQPAASEKPAPAKQPARGPRQKGAGADRAGASEEAAAVPRREPSEGSSHRWSEVWVEILRVRFSQEQIHPFFHRRGPIADVLPEIDNEPSEPEDFQDQPGQAVDPGVTVRLKPPFEAIRCIRRREHHDDVVTLDNRRLYALQRAAVERWPARCLARVRVAEGLSDNEMWAEGHKLAEGGLGPMGSGRHRAGKPAAFMEHLCGDVEVFIADRGASYEAWEGSAAILARCGSVAERAALPPAAETLRAQAPPDLEPEEAAVWADTLAAACESALADARLARDAERQARSAVEDAQGIARHASANEELRVALARLRREAIAGRGVFVKRVGDGGDRDGYISMVEQAAALKRLLGGT